VKRKVALKKSAVSSGEDLQIALEEGEAAADEVVRLFRPDDRIRYLPRGKLWSFVIEGDFWKANKTDKGSYDRSQLHIAYLLDRALKDGVLNHQDIVEGISVGKICTLMPRGELETAMNSALGAGRRGHPFSDRDLYDNLTSLTLVNYIPLPHIWDEVVHPCAIEHGMVDGTLPSARLDKAALGTADEGAAKPTSANTNDQPLSAQRPSVTKPVVNPVPVVKRPQGPTTTPLAVAVKPAAVAAPAPAPVKASMPQEPSVASVATQEEDEAFDVHFDNLTASKG
jgi:hypothetical protein